MQKVVFLMLALYCALSSKVYGQIVPVKVNELSQKEAFDGWINLYTGDIKNGWRSNKKANWRVNQDGELTVSKGEVGLLRTTSQFDDFTLRLEFRTAAQTNSGVFIRTNPDPQNPVKDCYEINIASPDNPFPTGSIVGRLKGKPLNNFDYSKWHTLEISCKKERVTVKVDGLVTATYRDPEPLGKGYIGLQHNSGPVSFRNVFIKPEGLGSCFTGKDLTGWKTYPEMKSKFTVSDGVLKVKGGPGQLETRSNYQDFVLQLKVKTNASRLNSGIFFRCIPGEKMNGYESQIHNGFLQGDRNRPEDCGTGGIFRRKDARRVVGNDREWLIKTLIVNGPHIATWVNGEPVCEWTDQRKPNPNPRRGLRLEAGTIMIQGHDPTTDIDFKEIFIREIQPRRR